MLARITPLRQTRYLCLSSGQLDKSGDPEILTSSVEVTLPEIRRQLLDPSPEIESGEIQIPDDQDWGTGTFITVLKPNALPSNKGIASVIVEAPQFQVSLTVNPNKEVHAALGKVNSFPFPTTFQLPDNIVVSSPHTLIVAFKDWRVLSLTLDGDLLPDLHRMPPDLA